MVWRWDIGDSPEVKLALGVLLTAIKDYQRPTKRAEKDVQAMGFDSLEEELLIFFNGEWCKRLVILLNCDIDLLELLRQADKAP